MSDIPSVLRGGDEEIPQGPEDADLGDNADLVGQGDHEKPEEWMLPARMGGAEWPELAQHVASSSEAALNEGHSQASVDQYLGYKPNETGRSWMQRAWDSVFGESPPDGKISLGSSPTLRDDYAHALTDNTVKGAKDFADTYAASALDAAKNHGEVTDAMRRQASASAEGLASSLPDRHDFVDAAASVTDNPDSAERVRQELVKRWKDTGKSPWDIVKTDTDLEKFDPGLLGRGTLNVTASILGAVDAVIDIPHMAARLGDWGLEKLGAAKGEGFITRNTDAKSLFSFEDSFRKGLDVIDQLAGGKGMNLTPHSTPEALATEFVSLALPILATGGAATIPELAATGAKAAKFGAYGVALHHALNQVWDDGDPVGDVVKLLGLGTLAHITAGGGVRHFAPDEAGGPAIREIGIEDMRRDDLAHAEAQEKAAEPGFAQRLLADESGKLDLSGQGGDVAAKKRPSFNLKEPELAEGEKPPAPGESKILEVHRSMEGSEPERVGSMRISFPPEADGKTAFIDSMTAGKIGEANPIGARDIRKLATQFFDMHPNVDRIEGWRVSGARQRAGTEGLMTITRDQIEKPADVAKLAESYHVTDNILGGWLSNVKAVLGNDSGALNLGKIMSKLPQWYGPAAREKIAFDQSRTARRVWTSSWTKANADAKQWRSYVQAQLDKSSIGSYISKHMAEAKAAMELPDAADRTSAYRASHLGQLEMAINGQVPIAPNHPLYEPVMFMKRMRDFMHMESTQWHLDGYLPKTDYVKGYTSGLWKNANAKWEETHNVEHNPFGDTRYLKDKTYQDKFQGVQAGEIPKYLDPVQHLVHEVMNHSKQAIKFNMIDSVVKSFPGSAVGMQDTANPPKMLMPLKDTQYGNKQAYAPKGFAEMWNKQFDAGLLSDPFQEATMTTMQKVVGTLNSLKLIWPMFHVRTMIMATWADTLHEVESAGLGMAKGVITGDLPMVAQQSWLALKSLATGIPVLPKIYLQVRGKGREGFKYYNEQDPTVAKSLRSMQEDEIHDAIKDGGFGYSRGMENMVGHDPSLHKSIIRNIDRNDGVLGNVKNQFRALAETQREKWNNDWGVGTDESVARRGVNAIYRIPSHIVDEAARVSQTFSHFVFDYSIPRMQYGAIYEAAAGWRSRNPGATKQQLNAYVRQQIMDQENRKGELNMVNVFWPKTWKQGASLAMLSTGWKFGTYRGIAQAAGWDPDQGRWRIPLINNPTATMSVINTAASWMMMNAVHQYISTGTLPMQTDTPWKDLALFRTGTQGKRMGDVVPARGMNPGEPKEIYDLAHILFTAIGNPSKIGQGISEYAMAATNPLWQTLRAVVTDEDAIGHKIGEQPGGWMRFLKGQFLPMIADSNIWDRKDSGIPFWEQKWFGTREAASWAENPAGYERFLDEQRKKDEKSQLKRARQEVATYQNMDWLQEYIKDKEAAMAEGGLPSVGKGRNRRGGSHDFSGF